MGAQLGETLAERIALLGEVPDVPTHEELRGELGRERDPSAERPQRALDDEAVVPQQASRMIGAEGSFQGLRHEASRPETAGSS